jgi:hypothetical protein
VLEQIFGRRRDAALEDQAGFDEAAESPSCPTVSTAFATMASSPMRWDRPQPWLAAGFEGLDDDHAPAAARTSVRLVVLVTIFGALAVPARRGWVGYARSGTTLSLALLAETLALAGKIEEGLAALDDALARAAVSGERGWSAEIHRLRGELTGRLPYPDSAKAEGSFRTALAIAREQGTRGYELRAATSLARLWREPGRRGEARELLAPVYGSFTEGFDTQDLKEAKALLDELGI